MPPGRKPQAPGEADQRETKFKWNLAEGEGWQHGRRPAPPRNLTDDGKKAWQTWLGSWWAVFYTPDDLPGLELTVMQYDRAMRGDVDVAKVVPMLDRYGITPKGRQDLRWARASDVKKPVPVAPKVADEMAERRQSRRTKLA